MTRHDLVLAFARLLRAYRGLLRRHREFIAEMDAAERRHQSDYAELRGEIAAQWDELRRLQMIDTAIRAERDDQHATLQ